MKIAIIGSTGLKARMDDYKLGMIAEGHDVDMPYFDWNADTTLKIVSQNLANIKWADKVVVFWDGRSQGCKGDMYMAMALGKRMEWGFLEPKTERQGFEAYVKSWEK